MASFTEGNHQNMGVIPRFFEFPYFDIEMVLSMMYLQFFFGSTVHTLMLIPLQNFLPFLFPPFI